MTNGHHQLKETKSKTWTEARVRAFITSVLRAGSRRWPPKYETLNAAKTTRKTNLKTGRLAQHYKCNACKGEFPASEIQVNHKEPVVGLDGFKSWDVYISRLFCDKDKLEVLCVDCHKKITKEENDLRKEFQTKAEEATYQSWLDMKGRCYNEKSVRFYTHGARGIKVCKEWKESFDTFRADMGLKPDGHTLDRINNDGDYSPKNCRWATPLEQARNRRTNVWITYDGETLTLKQWAQSLNITEPALKKRLAKWNIKDALTKEKK